MRRLACVLIALILSFAGSAFAQTATTPFTAPVYYASAFNLWSLNAQSPNSYTFQGRTICTSAGQNVNFFVFNTNAPVYIADANSANSEIATPSSVINTAGSCGVALAPSHSHYNFQLRSGTAGLQEAINTVKAGGGIPALIALDRNWWSGANQLPGTKGTTILGAAVGGPGVIIQDITVAPTVYYTWGGTAYAKNTNTVVWTNAPPTAAAGAASGSGPTIANGNTSTQLSGIVNLTTGTTTTTGTIFTETFLAAAAGGFGYSTGGSCTVVQTSGPTVGFTSAIAGTTRVLTVTVSTPVLVDSTAYSFSYNCQ